MNINKLLLAVLVLILSTGLIAKDKKIAHPTPMNPELLLKSITEYADEEKLELNKNLISFHYKKINLYCIFDTKADRMRIISPIAQAGKVPPELLINALKANYHTVLDARYAIGDDLLYSAFIHPLSPLTVPELQSAILQVATAAATFGSSFTSGELMFPGQGEAKKETRSAEKDPQT
ncbi:MAG: hypothetical protein COW84_07240 [Gammaproteobacteria bacterium CG22_combo_CG10-13_8_21_14_all_40_8]|nr:MAG: hypothetical protein COW84_07240 [Gammaproteobacteria bacterium CG22_combo_CG10-13_8_21_14_all_40_8]